MAVALGTLLVFAAASLSMAWAREFLLAAYLNLMGFELVLVLNAFVYGSADIGAKASSFPSHMLVLPATTGQLVGWPMLYGCGFYAIVWMLSAGLLLLPAGFHPPMIWPATMMAAVVAWMQAISWSPFPTPYARVPAVVVAIAPLFLLGLWAGLYPASQFVSLAVTAGNLGWILAAFGVGVNGVSRTRTGNESDFFESHRKKWWASIERRFSPQFREQPPFRSAAAAQLWHECRRNARMLPIMTAFVGVPMLPLMCLPILSGEKNHGLLIGSITVTPAMLGLGLFIFFPLMISMLNGGSTGKFDYWGKSQMSSFFATRPMETSGYVIVKIKAAAITALSCWAIVLLLFVVWAALEASSLNQHESLMRALLGQSTPRSIAATLLAIVGLLFLTWRNLVSGMWVTLCGRKWLANAIGFGTLGLMMIAGFIPLWIYRHPEIQPVVLAFGPWILGAAVAIKLFAATAVFTALWHCQLIEAQTAAMFMAGWFALASGAFAVVCCFVSPTWGLAAAVFLVVPLTSLAAAPLALFANRHR
jgi:hypothetical protein